MADPADAGRGDGVTEKMDITISGYYLLDRSSGVLSAKTIGYIGYDTIKETAIKVKKSR